MNDARWRRVATRPADWSAVANVTMDSPLCRLYISDAYLLTQDLCLTGRSLFRQVHTIPQRSAGRALITLIHISFHPSLYVTLPILDSDEALLDKVLRDDLDRSLNINLVRLNRDLGLVRSLVRRRDARELLDLSSTSLLVEALGVPSLNDRERSVDEDLDERRGGGGGGVEGASELTVGLVCECEEANGCEFGEDCNIKLSGRNAQGEMNAVIVIVADWEKRRET